MSFGLNIRTLGAAFAAFLSVATAGQASAESAYVSQAPTGAFVTGQPATLQGGSIVSGTPQVSARPAIRPTPETALPRASGGNLAQTLQVGSYNQVAHLQAGANNTSTVGVIGNYNNVGVLQAGNNLRSNLVLLGTQGLNVGVLQPNGSAPVNVLIARLPNGGLLIKR
jgi:hypothetical protein